MRPDGVDIIHQIDVGVVVISPWDIVGMAVIVATHLDNYQISRLFYADVPLLGLMAVSCRSARSRIRGMVPEPLLVSC